MSDEKLAKIWKHKATGDLVIATSSSMDRFENSKDSSTIGSVVANVKWSGKLINFFMAGDEKDPPGNISGLLLCAMDQPKIHLNPGFKTQQCLVSHNILILSTGGFQQNQAD
jgi:hypothetical protein